MPPMPPKPDQEELRRRFRAALALAGLDIKDLPQHIGAKGYSLGTLYAMNSQTGRDIYPKDYAILAEACGLTREWFTADFRSLGQGPHLDHDKVSERLAQQDEQIRALMADVSDATAAVTELSAALAQLALEHKAAREADRPDELEGGAR